MPLFETGQGEASPGCARRVVESSGEAGLACQCREWQGRVGNGFSWSGVAGKALRGTSG